jgi:hypothetical protein
MGVHDVPNFKATQLAPLLDTGIALPVINDALA